MIASHLPSDVNVLPEGQEVQSLEPPPEHPLQEGSQTAQEPSAELYCPLDSQVSKHFVPFKVQPVGQVRHWLERGPEQALQLDEQVPQIIESSSKYWPLGHIQDPELNCRLFLHKRQSEAELPEHSSQVLSQETHLEVASSR